MEVVIDTYGLPERSEHTITDEETPDRELESVGEREEAVNEGETTPNVWAMASPIVQEGTVYGSVGVAGPNHRMGGDRVTDPMPATVSEAVATIELELEYESTGSASASFGWASGDDLTVGRTDSIFT